MDRSQPGSAASKKPPVRLPQHPRIERKRLAPECSPKPKIILYCTVHSIVWQTPLTVNQAHEQDKSPFSGKQLTLQPEFCTGIPDDRSQLAPDVYHFRYGFHSKLFIVTDEGVILSEASCKDSSLFCAVTTTSSSMGWA